MQSSIFTLSFFVSLIASTIRLATPILIPALGQIYTQRAGILNLGVEGTMLMGAIAAFSVAAGTDSLWLGILAGIVAGVVFSLIFAWLTITVRANQVISGIGLNILATGLAAFIYRVIFGIRALPAQVEPFRAIDFGALSEMSVLGPILFQHNWLVYFAFLIVPLNWFIMEKTVYGLKIKAVGENPRAADSKGISVAKIRYSAVLLGGAYAGLGGAFMTIAYLNKFTESVIGGRGYIAVSVVIFARFLPSRTALGALIFGFFTALQLRMQALGVNIPSQLLLALPYAATIVALILASKNASMPSAYTIPYSRMER